MSRKNPRITRIGAQKLRSGQTFWRCQISEYGTVYIHEQMLSGSLLRSVMRSMFPEDVPKNKRKVLSISLKIGPKDPAKWTHGQFLESINPGWSINAFRTRRAALRWKQEVEAGLHPEAVAQANEHWAMCRSMDDMMDYDDSYSYGREDAFDDYDGPDNLMTLEGGKPLMEVLKQRGQGEGVATYSEEAYVGTDKLPLFAEDGEADNTRFALEA